MIKNIYNKYKTEILYIFFGGCTTLVNIIVYFVLRELFGAEVSVSNIVAWLLSVIFAFVTNKFYVFGNKDTSGKKLLAQLGSFLGARVFSGALDTAIVVLFIDKLLFPELPVKILSNIIVVVINYVFSKLFIFKNK